MSNIRLRKPEAIHPLLRAGDLRRLRRVLDELDHVEIAGQLEHLTTDEQVQVFILLALERRCDVIGSMRPETVAALLVKLAPEEAASLLQGLEVDDVADILGQLDDNKLSQILARLDQEEAHEVEQLLAYPENSAGGRMSPELFRVRSTATVAEALHSLQTVEEVPDHTFYVYVIDEQERLVGLCSLHVLVTSPPDRRIQEVMETDIVSVSADTDQEKVADLVSRYDLIAIPVVDRNHRLLGVVEVDDIVDVLREEATEDILKMAGAGEQLIDTRSFTGSFRARWKWLLLAACGGLVTATSLTGFSEALQTVPTLAAFMPVVAGMGGNVGTQSSTIVVRGLAVGYVEKARLRSLIAREVALGACLGLLYGVLIASLSLVVTGSHTFGSLWLGVVIALGMTASMTIAAFVGTSVPLLLDRLHIDPAVATGPFVTTSVDVLGLLVYFWLATVLLLN